MASIFKLVLFWAKLFGDLSLKPVLHNELVARQHRLSA